MVEQLLSGSQPITRYDDGNLFKLLEQKLNRWQTNI